jgi:hypothetical protein
VSESTYEKLGAFYLGRKCDAETGAVSDELILYDSKDLTTHAVCVGMTGSGKTGLGVTLLEEAAIDGLPVIAIDPKGDLGNLLLTFPKLEGGDFLPWVDSAEAARHGRTPEQEARATAELWRRGLSDWQQAPERIARFADAAERTLYTPGSRAGRPLSILGSFVAPPPALREDDEAMRDRVAAAVSGLLGLLGIEADPIRSREHILLSTLIDRSWREGADVELGGLIHQIQKPPVQRIGVMDLDAFFPPEDRFELAMSLNALLASPGFSVWTEGEPLDVAKLLYTETGRPRMSIISIAHLSDPQRMLVVTLLLNQLVSWMRAQPGSRTLRALLYMDEVFGYFPPTANPPSKTPMLTLLKQARAYGLGCVLATQNPVDLDYKGLSNAGTWFLGRLQTERDKARVIDGLEGASAAAGAAFDRARLERTLSGLGSRVFLMNNVHDDEPVVFHTRWALSYLAGPLTRDQIKTLSSSAPQTPTAQAAQRPPSAVTERATERPAVGAIDAAAPAKRPALPPDIDEAFLPVTRAAIGSGRVVYRPSLLGLAMLHHRNARANVDEWGRRVVLCGLAEGLKGSPWHSATITAGTLPELQHEPEPSADFANLPAVATRAKSYPRWAKMLKTHLYREAPLHLLKSRDPKLISQPGESEGEFRARLVDSRREKRDLALEKLHRRFAPKLQTLRDRIARAEQRVESEEEQYRDKKAQSVISIGATLVGALFGRKLASSRNVGRATTAARSLGRAASERGDIARAEERVEALQEQLAEIEARFEDDVAGLEVELDPGTFECEAFRVAPAKADLDVERLLLVWAPWHVDADGIAEPLFRA